MDTSDLTIYGDFNSGQARQLNIQLKKCTGRPDCKSDTDIVKFFKNKFLLVMLNQVRFDPEKFG